MRQAFTNHLLMTALVMPLAISAVATAADSLGQVSTAGEKLARSIDEFDVEHLWLPNFSIAWRSGKSLHPSTDSGVHTHCSAFVAAACERMGVPMLAPPPQAHLANKQGEWLLNEGRAAGWKELARLEAQRMANEGQVVVASFKNESTNYHNGTGHIALVRPAAKTAAEVDRDGPQIAQAGGKNFSSGTLVHGFGKAQGLVRFFVFVPPKN
jgi:hypothetical protein